MYKGRTDDADVHLNRRPERGAKIIPCVVVSALCAFVCVCVCELSPSWGAAIGYMRKNDQGVVRHTGGIRRTTQQYERRYANNACYNHKAAHGKDKHESYALLSRKLKRPQHADGHEVDNNVLGDIEGRVGDEHVGAGEARAGLVGVPGLADGRALEDAGEADRDGGEHDKGHHDPDGEPPGAAG